jgi:uncharacterized protein
MLNSVMSYLPRQGRALLMALKTLQDPPRKKQFPLNEYLSPLGVGLLFAFIITGIMKGKLKSVRYQPAATSYVRKDSLNIAVSKDLFLYRKVDRRAIPKNNSSGSSTHRSSSGRTHGGSSGKF